MPRWGWVPVALLAVLPYLNALTGAFVYDDVYYIVQRASMHDIARIPHILGLTDFRFHYRALRDASYVLDWTLSGGRPLWFHLVNLGLHLGCSLLALRLFRAFGMSAGTAVLGAALFAVHPLHTEAVTYISGRKDLLATLFFLAGGLAFAAYRRRGGVWRLGLAGGSYVLAVMGKEVAITLPVVWLMYDVWVVGDAPGRGLAAVRMALARFWRLHLAGAAAAGWVAWRVLTAGVTNQHDWFRGDPISHLVVAAGVQVQYLQRVLFPVNLVADYGSWVPVAGAGPMPMAWWTVALMAILAAALGRGLLRRRPWALWGLLYVVTVIPVAHVVPFHILVAERFVYLPSLGLCALAAEGLTGLRRLRPGAARPLAAGTAAVLVLLAGLTWDRNRDWRTSDALWAHDHRVLPGSPRPYAHMADVHTWRGEPEQERVALEGAVARGEAYLVGQRLVLRYLQAGEVDKAEVVCRLAMMQAPSLDWPFTRLVHLLGRLERYDDLVDVYRFMLRVRPAQRQQILVEIARVLDQDATRHPDHAAIHLRAADAAWEAGRVDLAAGHYGRYLELAGPDAKAGARARERSVGAD